MVQVTIGNKMSKDKRALYNKEYYIKNKEKHNFYSKKYYIKNKKELTLYKKQYQKNKLKLDPIFRLSCNLRRRTRLAFKSQSVSKTSSTFKLLGCTGKELVIYLQSKFTEGMTLENHGLWHIDHIIPCSSFDLSNEEEQRKCFHYTNLQPLWAEDNLTKSDHINN
jgi:hypothetical protein